MAAFRIISDYCRKKTGIEHYQQNDAKINNTKVPLDFLGKNDRKWLFDKDGMLNYTVRDMILCMMSAILMVRCIVQPYTQYTNLSRAQYITVLRDYSMCPYIKTFCKIICNFRFIFFYPVKINLLNG